jgi:hypothetical protein
MIANLATISRDLRLVRNAETWAGQESIAQHPDRSSSAFDAQIDLVTKRHKIDGLGQKRLRAVL